MDESLKPLRDAIDAIDGQLVDLLAERAHLAQRVGQVKAAHGAMVYRPDREAEVLRAVAARNPGPLSAAAVKQVMREVISVCRALEEPLKVAYLGPAGTFSELALQRQLGSGVVKLPCASIDEAVRAAETGRAQLAIVPVENSTEGAVGRSLDLLLTTPLKIIAEISIPIHHCLLTQSGSLSGVQRVYSHPQTFGQCVHWLGEHASALEQIAVSSNAQAASMAAQDPASAAIAGENAALCYGLKTVAQNIEDAAQNRTRFLLLGKQATRPTGRDKTSLILSVPNQAGAMYALLAPLARHGVSMTRFESRPARLGAWDYNFYVDIEGHEQDPKVMQALGALRADCSFYKSLGSYPADPLED